MTSLRWAQVFLSLLPLTVVGCGPTEINVTKKSSYADLVVIYNAEVQAMDNLEAKRKILIAEYSEKAQTDAIKAAMNSIESVAKSASASSPNNALDQAVAAAEAQSQLLKKLEDSRGASSSNANSEFPEELKRKLSELDDAIAKQKERVERARIARDAEEAK